MKALYIDCCIRGEESRSARLAQAFLENLSPNYEVTHRCLMEEALYPLTAETLRQPGAAGLRPPDTAVDVECLHAFSSLLSR